MTDGQWIPDETWDQIEMASADLAQHIAACDEAVRSMVYRYDPGHRDALFEEGVTKGWVVVHNGVGPASMLEVAVLADKDGNAFIEPTGRWQATNVVDDGGDQP